MVEIIKTKSGVINKTESKRRERNGFWVIKVDVRAISDIVFG